MTAPTTPGHPGAIFSLLQRAFGDAPMEAIFSEAATVEGWLRTEAELARSQAAVGDLDLERAEAVAAACTLASIDLERLWEGTANVGYPILPLVRQVEYEAALVSRGQGIDLREALLRTPGVDAGAVPLIEPEDSVGESRADAEAAVADWRRGQRASSTHVGAAADVDDGAAHEAGVA